ncbi:unnamed protein product [Closterium sp. NIES-64]|nr:unnamed protein product [Closterium sp. NIES-64]
MASACHNRVVALVVLIVLTNSRLGLAAAEQRPIASFFGDPHFEGAGWRSFPIHRRAGRGLLPALRPLAAHQHGNGRRLGAAGADASLGDGFLQSIVLDDVAQRLSPSHILESDDGTLRVHHVGVTESNGVETETLRIQSGGRQGADFLVHIRPEAVDRQSPVDAFVHFSVEVLSGGGLTDPHGVMGQTFRSSQKERSFAVSLQWSRDAQAWEVAGDNGDGYLDGSVDSYRSSSLVAADCAFLAVQGGGRSRRRAERGE